MQETDMRSRSDAPGSNLAFITSIGTAVPDNRIAQDRIAEFMSAVMQLSPAGERKLKALYRRTGIRYRHSVLADYGRKKGEFTFYPNPPDREFPSVEKRMKVYERHATPLAARAAARCLDKRGLPADRLTHLITVSCTGMYAPGTDIELIGALGMKSSVHRLAINYMGCYGAFNGMKAAASIVRAEPDARVLVVCVELCSLHFQNRETDDFLLSNALFSDGAAAFLVEAERGGLEIMDFACDVFSGGKDEMGWYIREAGFEMKLTANVPEVLRVGVPLVLERLLAANGLTRADISCYAFHPGGRRILEVLEAALGLGPGHNAAAYEVLSAYGNMSSCTVLFVLEKLIAGYPAGGETLLFSGAFGPGLSAETALLKIV